MGRKVISIVRDKLVVTLHESTDESLNFQEGETEDREDSMERTRRQEPRGNSVGADSTRTQGTEEKRTQVRLGINKHWHQMMEGLACAAEEYRLQSRGADKQ